MASAFPTAKAAATSPVTREIASQALSLQYDRLPAEAIAIARHCLLDWIGVTLAGWNSLPVRLLLEEVDEEGGRPLATLLGAGRRAGVLQAALVNGTASHALDFDDVHLASRVHPSVPVMPAVLAVAEHRKASGRDVILAFLAGVETQSRVAAYMGEGHYRLGWHNTATFGTFGAALATARLIGLDLDQACHALGIAATQAAGLRAVFGTSCKPLHAGKAAANGVFSARLAKRGFDGRTDLIEAADGFAALQGDQVFVEAAVDGSERLAAQSIIFKYHASCYGTHGPIDAAVRLRDRLGADVARLDRIALHVEPQYLSVCNIADPKTDLQAKFSLRHTVALALAGRDTMAAESFSVQATEDAELRHLRQKMTVVGDAGLPRANCELRASAGGHEYRERADVSAAEADMARQSARLQHKFRTLCGGLIEDAAAERIIVLCDGLDRLDDLTEITALCRIRQ